MAKHIQIVVIGHSHVRFMEAATKNNEDAKLFRFFHLQDEKYKPAADRHDNEWVLNKQLASDLETIKANPSIHFALSIGGAFHNVLGLTPHPDAFTFQNPWKSTQDVTKGRRLLPFNLIREVMRETLVNQIGVLRTLASNLPRPLVQLQSPPPISDEDALRKMPGVYGEAIEKYGISPAEERYAMWRIQSDLFEEVCREERVDFLQAPSETVAEDGFLIPKAWHDPTHGNRWYGGRVLCQLKAYFGIRSESVDAASL